MRRNFLTTFKFQGRGLLTFVFLVTRVMKKDKFSQYWAQVEYCHFKAGLVELPVSKQIWNQLAEDWATLAQSQMLPRRQRSLLASRVEREHVLAA